MELLNLPRELVSLGYELISTGGTKKALQEQGIPVLGVSDVTGFPEILEGRVKTLNPLIHGGLLAKQDDAAASKTARRAWNSGNSTGLC